jgi:phytoene synthase
MSITAAKNRWEAPLIEMAFEAARTYKVTSWPAAIERSEKLVEAYLECAAITRKHSRSFYLATALLPASKRIAVRSLYAFCRTADDIVDNGNGNALVALRRWRDVTLSPYHLPNAGVPLAWVETRRRYYIPTRYAEQLLEGIERDLVQRRYQTFEELAVYCYGAASTVGLMSMHIIGFDRQEAIPYAVKLGVALQLTNILRDVGEDWRAGRLYLPLSELKAFGLDEAAIERGQVVDNWRAFMRFQIERNRRLYTEAMPGIAMLHPDGRFAVAAAASLYRAILDDIEKHNYDVFTRRAHVSDLGKLRRLPGIYRAARL